MIDSNVIIKTAKKSKKRLRVQKVHWGTAIFLVVWSIYVLIPFYIMFNIATKTRYESTYMDYSLGWKQGFHLSAFKTAFADSGLGCTILSGFANTMLYTVPTVVIGLFVGAMQAYAFAKLKWRGKKFFFTYKMLGFMMPDCVSLTTKFLWYDTLGWVGTPLPMIIPGMFCGMAQIFFLRQFMITIPNELCEAAKIDGMSDYGVFLRIIFPLSLPAIYTQALFCFIGSYNNYLTPLIYLDDPALYTLQIALKFHASQHKDNAAAVMAASLVAITPLVVLYGFTQKYILKGLNMGSGLKG